MASRSSQIIIKAKDHASKAFGRVGASAKGMVGKLFSARSLMAGVLGGAAIAAGAAGLSKTFGDVGDEVAKMSKRTGVAVETLSEFRYVASQSGTDFGAVEKSLAKMQRSIYDAGRGLSTQTDALADVGLAYRDLNGLSPEKQFKLLADKISAVEDPTKKAAISMALFGRSGTAMLPMFAKGAAGIEALQKEARGLGLTITGEQAAAAEKFTDDIDRMWKSVKALTFQVGGALAPVVSTVADWFTTAAVNVGGWFRSLADGSPVMDMLTGTMEVLAEAGNVAFDFLGMAANSFASVFSGVGVSVGGVVEWMKDMFGMFRVVGTVAFEYLGSVLTTFGSIFWGVGDSVGSVLDVMSSVFKTAFKFVIGYWTFLEVVIVNWKSTLELACKAAALAVVGFAMDVKHWFTVVIPDLLGWFGRNWRQVFTDLWNATKTIFANMWTNISGFFAAVWGMLKGEGFNFQWTGLLEGFESTLEELPKIAERQLTGLEKKLGARVGELSGQLGKEFNAKFSARIAMLDNAGGSKKIAADAVDQAVAKAGVGTPAPTPAPTTAAGSKGTKTLESRFLTLAGGRDDASKRTAKNTEAMAAESKLTAAAAKRTAAAVEQLVTLAKDGKLQLMLGSI